MSTPIEELSRSADHDRSKKKPAKMRKRSSKKSSFLEGLLPDNINLTINMNDEDKEIVLNKMDEMKDELIYNWRIVQVLMFLGIMLGFIGSAL
jgi:hypothetical protein|tara:strand:+ start:926 stop:1204 length:279 start_codon:yes stop_codon:yes gene_type:complete